MPDRVGWYPKVTDCNKQPKPEGRIPPPLPPTNPGGVNCTKNPHATECQVTPGQADCDEGPEGGWLPG